MTLWGSRFDRPPDEAFKRFNDSFHFDWRLWEVDIRGSLAYARALERAGVISSEEAGALETGLVRVGDEFAHGEFVPRPGDEDIHTAVERRLGELIGPAAGKLHTGRSRNDQVATDTRLYVLDAIARVDGRIRDAQAAIVEQAETHPGVLMPGYTHLRRAQPVLLAHYLLSFFWMLQRDRERFAGTRARASVLPLGAGALAGNPFAIDRDWLARELGLACTSENSIDVVSDRDYVVEFLFDAALLATHTSRLAEDLILFSSAEFGYFEIADEYATGSSLMPQKKNPDALELLRGKTGRLIGGLTGLLVTLKGLPSSYDKDLQEDKEPLFDAIDTLEPALTIAAGVIGTLEIRPERMRAALDESMLATDLAEYLARHGVPFRESHRYVGELVKLAEQRGVPLSALTDTEVGSVSIAFGPDWREILDFDKSVRSREIAGGTGPEAVRAQIEKAKTLLVKPV